MIDLKLKINDYSLKLGLSAADCSRYIKDRKTKRVDNLVENLFPLLEGEEGFYSWERIRVRSPFLTKLPKPEAGKWALD